MLRGLYSAANAMRHRALEVDITANNIANVNTDGYKGDRASMRSFGDMLLSRIEQTPEEMTDLMRLQPQIGRANLGGPAVENEYIDFSPGTPRVTGNPLDLYLQGPGFFVINTPSGERFTRTGAFTLDGEGRIVTQSGYELQSVNGGSIRATGLGEIEIDQYGRVAQDGAPIGQIRIVEFPDTSVIEKEGNTLFRIAGTIQNAPYPGTNTAVEQGTIEGSNVDAIDALVQLITAQRAFEAASRAVDMFNQNLSRVSNDLGRVTG